MVPRTRLDKVVQVRKRAEDDALAGLARARAAVETARDRLVRAVQATRHDGRTAGPVELWHLEEAAHRRALQVARSAQNEMQKAARGEATARDDYAAARQDREIVRRVQDRRRAEIVVDLERRERRETDEIAALTFKARR